MSPLDGVVAAVFVAALVATLRHVWRGGTTLNDHAVAAVVAGCMAVYPTMWVGGRLADVAGWALFSFVLAGVFGIWVLFAVMDSRREQDGLRPAVAWSQVAYAFSLWTGLFVLGWWSVAVVLWAAGLWTFDVVDVLWPWPVFIPAGVLAGWGTAFTWLDRDRVRVVRLPGWFGDRSFRVVQLSDLHASPTTTGRDLHRTVDTALGLAPDLVVVTGDLVMPFSEDNHGWLLDALGRFEVPVLVCPGNHDLPVADVLADELRAMGIHWLADDATVVTVPRAGGDLRIEVVGIDFVWQKLADHVRAVVDGLPRADGVDGRLLLLHDPRGFRGVPEGRFDLVLCGHTHGGQVGTDMFGWPGSVLGWMGLYDQGLFERPGARLWVHRGNWHFGLPPRMGIASEVVAFDVVGAPSVGCAATSP